MTFADLLLYALKLESRWKRSDNVLDAKVTQITQTKDSIVVEASIKLNEPIHFITIDLKLPKETEDFIRS